MWVKRKTNHPFFDSRRACEVLFALLGVAHSRSLESTEYGLVSTGPLWQEVDSLHHQESNEKETLLIKEEALEGNIVNEKFAEWNENRRGSDSSSSTIAVCTTQEPDWIYRTLSFKEWTKTCSLDMRDSLLHMHKPGHPAQGAIVTEKDALIKPSQMQKCLCFRHV